LWLDGRILPNGLGGQASRRALHRWRQWVTAQFRAVGTQNGPMAPFPANNKPFSLEVCEVWHFNANGEADEGHNYSDGMGLAMQLGHIKPPA